MDKLFGGNDAEADLDRIAEIRSRIGLAPNGDTDAILEGKDIVTHIESVGCTK
jgi:hypothetical protein